jgi:hypothetical protein
MTQKCADFLPAAGDDQIRMLNDFFFDCNAMVDAVFFVHIFLGQATLEQRDFLIAAQRMAGENKGHIQ